MKWGCPLLFLLRVKISHPVSFTNKVFSNCADHWPSAVTAVHLSGHISSRHVPIEIIGSIVKQWPAFITPIARFSMKKQYNQSKTRPPQTVHPNYLHNEAHSALYETIYVCHVRNNSSPPNTHATVRASV